MAETPDVTFMLAYDDALRLAYMAQFPTSKLRPEQDERIAAVVSQAVDYAEAIWEAEGG